MFFHNEHFLLLHSHNKIPRYSNTNLLIHSLIYISIPSPPYHLPLFLNFSSCHHFTSHHRYICVYDIADSSFFPGNVLRWNVYHIPPLAEHRWKLEVSLQYVIHIVQSQISNSNSNVSIFISTSTSASENK
jgi:hypothetical protein